MQWDKWNQPEILLWPSDNGHSVACIPFSSLVSSLNGKKWDAAGKAPGWPCSVDGTWPRPQPSNGHCYHLNCVIHHRLAPDPASSFCLIHYYRHDLWFFSYRPNNCNPDFIEKETYHLIKISAIHISGIYLQDIQKPWNSETQNSSMYCFKNQDQFFSISTMEKKQRLALYDEGHWYL